MAKTDEETLAEIEEEIRRATPMHIQCLEEMMPPHITDMVRKSHPEFGYRAAKLTGLPESKTASDVTYYGFVDSLLQYENGIFKPALDKMNELDWVKEDIEGDIDNTETFAKAFSEAMEDVLHEQGKKWK